MGKLHSGIVCSHCRQTAVSSEEVPCEIGLSDIDFGAPKEFVLLIFGVNGNSNEEEEEEEEEEGVVEEVVVEKVEDRAGRKLVKISASTTHAAGEGVISLIRKS